MFEKMALFGEMLLGLSILAPSASAQFGGGDSFTLTQRSYIQQDGTWYVNNNGARDKIVLDELLVRHADGSGPSDAELGAMGVTIKTRFPIGLFVVKVNERQDPFAVAVALESAGYYVEFNAKVTYATEPDDL